MKRKTFITSIIAIIISLFSISYTFANNDNKMDNVKDGIRNVVGGAENTVENVAGAAGTAVRNGFNTLGDATKNTMDATKNTVEGMTDNDSNYNSTRTSTFIDTNNNGTSNSVYSWTIIGITAVGIGVLLWSYFRQKRENTYIDSDEL